jgi:sarcosine oxidase gamma subunit
MFNGYDVTRKGFNVGEGTGELKITLASDGGAASFSVIDDKERGVGEASVVLFPVEAGSLADFGSMLRQGTTDQNGSLRMAGLAPGQYLVAAVAGGFEDDPEMLAKVWVARSRANKVEVSSGTTLSETLKLIRTE